MVKSSKRKQIRHSSPIVSCQLDIDALLMSEQCTPEFIEENLDVDDAILYDAILYAINQSWLLKLDVLKRFSKKFRTKLFNNFNAFGNITISYFGWQVNEYEDSEFKTECLMNLCQMNMANQSILKNPVSMLGNDIANYDRSILNGKNLTLRNFIINRIHEFLDSNNKKTVDFSYSIFLTEMLSPKFFITLSEAEQLVIINNLDSYFKTMEALSRPTLFGHMKKQELNPPQALLKYILNDTTDTFSERVKLLAWKQLGIELKRVSSKSLTMNDMFDQYAIYQRIEPDIVNAIAKFNVCVNDLNQWLVNANGLFESFEFDCNMHGIFSRDLIPILLISSLNIPIFIGMIPFYTDDDRKAVFKTTSSLMKSFR